MSKEKPSYEFERAILEASAVLVTLFFIILQLGEGWRNPWNIASICLLSFPFSVSAILAAVIMFLGSSSADDLGELASMFTGGLRGLELVFFVTGMLGLSILLYGMTSVYSPTLGSLFLYFAAASGAVIVVMFVGLTIIHRWHRRKA